MSDKIQFTSNKNIILAAMQQQIHNALEICGGTAENYAKKNCPVDTGALRNSITHTVDDNEHAAYVGTNSEYGVYVEFGTGVHYAGGRRTPWSFQDSHGEWHTTRGQKAQPYLKPALSQHRAEYNNIIKTELKH